MRKNLPLFALAASLFLSGCDKLSYVQLTRFSPKGSRVLSGRILGLSQNSQTKLGVSLSCTNPKVEIYRVDNQGRKAGPALASTSVKNDGTFLFNDISAFKDELNGDKTKVRKLMIEVSGCADPLSRFITGNTSQDLSLSASLVSYLAGYVSLNSIKADRLGEFYDAILDYSDQAAAYSMITSNQKLSEQFEELFGVPPTILQEVPPQILQTNVAPSVNELEPLSMTANLVHWWPSYKKAAEWEESDTVTTLLTTGLNATWIPEKNKQGSRTIVLTVGKDDGTGRVDRSSPFQQQTFIVTVHDTYPATPPALMLKSDPVSSSQIVNLQIDTGAEKANCETFSKLAITENDPVPPLLDSDYSITCTTNGLQDISYTITPGDGLKVIRIWAKDSAGNISSIASTVSMTLDQTAPQISLTSLNSGAVRGGVSALVTWSASDVNFGSTPIEIVYSDDGGSNWSPLTTHANTGIYSWSVPVIDSNQVRLKVVATDLAGNQSSAESSNLTIDSTPPAAPSVQLKSGAATNDEQIEIEVSSCADVARVLVTESLTAPTTSSNGWTDCLVGSLFYQISGDGNHELKVWAQDAVGNISSNSTNLTVLLDTTPPSVMLTSLNGGNYISGNANQTPAINEQTITWTASDAGVGMGTQPISLYYSNDSGANWVIIDTNLTNIGSYVWTVPPIDTAQGRIRVHACDSLGNCADATSASDFTIDSTAPQFSSLQVAQGSVVATPFATIASSVSDNFTAMASLEIQVRDGAATPISSGWIPYTSSYPFSFSHVQGDHAFHVFVKDQAGNIASQTTNVRLDSGTPPIVSLLSPPAGTMFTPGSNVVLSFHIHDNELPMPSDSVELSFSTNGGASFIPIGTYTPYSNSSTLTDETLSVTWAVPASVGSSAVIFRVLARDAAGNAVAWASDIYNHSSLRRIAGGVSDTNGISARFTMFNVEQYHRGRISILIRDPMSNDFFIGDLNQGLRYIRGETGIVKLAPYAGGGEVGSVTRDNFGNIYGCNSTGIYKFDRTFEQWDKILDEACDLISAWKTNPGKFYFVRSNRLHFYDGTTVTHVAFNGTSIYTATPDQYNLDDPDPRNAMYPKMEGNKYAFAVNDQGDVLITDHCPWNGQVSGCSPRLMTYHRASNSISTMDFPVASFSGSVLWRTSNSQALYFSDGVLEEDPFLGTIYYYRGGVLKQYPSDVTFSNFRLHFGYEPTGPETATIAGLSLSAGDGGPALNAHLEYPKHIILGKEGGSDAGQIYVPKGNGCCMMWGSWRRILANGIIENFNNDGHYMRNATVNTYWAANGSGIFNWRGIHYIPGSSPRTLWTGSVSACTSTPQDGVPANSVSWPREVYYGDNYASGLHHSDGYIYLAGYRNTSAPVPPSSLCTGTADVMIKRFSYNEETGTVGLIEHVAGAAQTPVSTPTDANGELASTFVFSTTRIREMKENTNPGGNGNIFFIEGNRIRVIHRADPSDLSTWRIYDVTKPISGLSQFALGTTVDALGTTGYIYFVTTSGGANTIKRYHLGSGSSSLNDDTIDDVDLGGITTFTITDVEMTSSGRLIFTDNKSNGALYGVVP